MLKIGSHVSFKSPGYMVDSINESIANGANAMMIYLGPPQSAKRVDVNKFNIEQCNKLNLFSQIKKEDIVVHAPYIINPSSFEKSDFAINFLIEEIKRMNFIGLKYLVLHPGSSLKQDINETIKHLSSNLKKILNETNDVVICIETMAGKGSEVGISLEQLKIIMDNVDSERIAICLDTCHLWDAGYNLKDDFQKNNGEDFLNKLKELNLIEKVKVIHLNDSKNELGSKKDRHANIGHGFIGLKALKNFAHHNLFQDIPIILETPYIDNKSPYKEEIKLIKGEK